MQDRKKDRKKAHGKTRTLQKAGAGRAWGKEPTARDWVTYKAGRGFCSETLGCVGGEMDGDGVWGIQKRGKESARERERGREKHAEP